MAEVAMGSSGDEASAGFGEAWGVADGAGEAGCELWHLEADCDGYEARAGSSASSCDEDGAG